MGLRPIADALTGHARAGRRSTLLSAIAGLASCAMWFAPCHAVVLYAAGDVAQCGKNAPAASAAAATARLVPLDSYVAMLGDSAYPRADTATLERCYGPTWGRFVARTYAVPGNHDYVDESAADFVRYFGQLVANPLRYRVDLGGWWFIGLDSNIDTAALAEQLEWLQRELAQIKGDHRCIVAAWHHPLFSTGLHHGDGEAMRPVWEALSAAGADIVLNGHEHFYESFRPKDAHGMDTQAGLREFVVGTGGAKLVDVSLAPWQHRAFARRHGLLELALDSGSYQWRFVATGGKTLDHGDATCNNAAQSR